MGYVTCDTQEVMNMVSKFQLPRFRSYDVWKIWRNRFSQLRKYSCKKKAASFWTFSKRVGGSNPNPKVLGYFWVGFLLDIFQTKGGGVEDIPKVLG